MWRLSRKDRGKPAGRTAGEVGSWTPTSTRVHERRAVAMNASDHPAELQRGRRGLETSAPPAGCHIGCYALRGLRASEPDLVRPMAEKFARAKVPARGYARMKIGRAS